jgi:hypothetical protein
LFCVHLGVMGNWRNRPPRRIFRQPRAPWPPPEPHDPGPPPGNSKLLLLFNQVFVPFSELGNVIFVESLEWLFFLVGFIRNLGLITDFF